MADFTSPDFLTGHSVDEVYATMREELPDDIDSSEGSHVWNFLRPTALVAAELYEATLPQVIMTIFPEWSSGEFLDAHAQARGMSRRAAVAATGMVTVTGATGLVIPAGARFSTVGTSDVAALEYVTTEEATMPNTGTVDIPVVCTEGGVKGNTGAGTIILVADGRSDVTSVTNAAATTGGLDIEDDESLRARILAYDRDRGTSYVGTYSDYIRWAKAASDEVGAVNIVSGSNGLVTMYITDADRHPASPELRQTVYNYIVSPNDPEARLLPLNAVLETASPAEVHLEITADVLLTGDVTLAGVKTAFLTAVQAYLFRAMNEGVIRQTRIGAILSGIEGVKDYQSLSINEAGSPAAASIYLASTDLPTTSAEDITLEQLGELL